MHALSIAAIQRVKRVFFLGRSSFLHEQIHLLADVDRQCFALECEQDLQHARVDPFGAGAGEGLRNLGNHLGGIACRQLAEGGFERGDAVLIVGFVIEGTGSLPLLVRAVGPTLESSFGVSGAVDDPKLTLFGANSTKIGENDDWGGDPQLTNAATAYTATNNLYDQRVGAFRIASLIISNGTTGISYNQGAGPSSILQYNDVFGQIGGQRT